LGRLFAAASVSRRRWHAYKTAGEARHYTTHPAQLGALPVVSQDLSPHALAPGTKIRDYTILSVIGTGGFSIVYKAMDNALMREVAIKEYFPSSFAVRAPDGTVQPHSREADTFNTGIVSFLNEGKLLASFDHPALVRVYRCWEESGTAYLAMKLYTGDTLRQAVEKERFVVTEASIQSLLLPICETLKLLHDAKCYHRDVAPDNILLADTHTPVLLDFGAARRAIEGTQVFTAILKPGYAPIEQYGDGELKQGPWTDIYALAGVVHFALVGNAPPTAISRILKDAMPRWREAFSGRLPDQWLDGFEAALSVKPENRPQSIEEFRTLLGWENAHYVFDPVTTMAQPRTTIAGARLPAQSPPVTGGTAPSRPVTQNEPLPRLATVPPRPVTAPPRPVTAPPTGRSVTELRADMAALDAIDEDKTVVVPRPSTVAPAPRTQPPPAEDPAAAIAAMAAAAAAAAATPTAFAAPEPAPTPAAAPAPAPAIAPAAVPAAAPAAARAPARPRPAPAPAREVTPAKGVSAGLVVGIASAVLIAGALAWHFMGRGATPPVTPADPPKTATEVATQPVNSNQVKEVKESKPANDVVEDTKPSIPKEASKVPVKEPATATPAVTPASKDADKGSPRVVPPPARPQAEAPPPRENKAAAAKQEARSERPLNNEPAGSQEADDEFDRAVHGKTTARRGNSPRCTTLNEAFSLGNQLTDDEQKFLRERCSK